MFWNIKNESKIEHLKNVFFMKQPNHFCFGLVLMIVTGFFSKPLDLF